MPIGRSPHFSPVSRNLIGSRLGLSSLSFPSIYSLYLQPSLSYLPSNSTIFWIFTLSDLLFSAISSSLTPTPPLRLLSYPRTATFLLSVCPDTRALSLHPIPVSLFLIPRFFLPVSYKRFSLVL